jgi:hypothetical protein
MERLGRALDVVEAVVGAGDRRETWSGDQRLRRRLPQMALLHSGYGLRCILVLCLMTRKYQLFLGEWHSRLDSRMRSNGQGMK